MFKPDRPERRGKYEALVKKLIDRETAYWVVAEGCDIQSEKKRVRTALSWLMPDHKTSLQSGHLNDRRVIRVTARYQGASEDPE